MTPMMSVSMWGVRLERAAEAGVERADGEEGDGCGDEKEIGHGSDG